MDLSNVTNEGNAHNSVKKKNKKRNDSEISDLGGEELTDGGTKKKKKSKVSGDVVDAQGDISKREGKSRKDKTEEILGASDEKVHDKGFDEEHAREGHMKKKKKKIKKETKNKQKSNDDLIDKKINDKTIDNVLPLKEKKQKKKKYSGAGSLDKELMKTDNVVSISDSEKSRDRGSKKRKEKSLESNTDGVTNAGRLENNECDEPAVPSGISIREGHMKKKENKTETKNKQNPNDDLAVNQISDKAIENVQSVKEKKRKKKENSYSGAGSLDKELMKNINAASISDADKSRDRSRKKRKEKSLESPDGVANDGRSENNECNETADPSENSNSNKKSRKVTFSENVEAFPPTDISSKKKKKLKDGSKENKNLDDGLIRGKRFSREEDEIIQNAVFKYIEDHQLGEQGLEMVLNCRAHRELKDCWKEIGEALPQRPYLAVYYRAHILFERSDTRKWSPEEIELVKKFHEKHGPDWKTLSVELGKHRFHVKDAWRRYKLPNSKKGNWSQEEYQNLFDLVNVDLSMKAITEKKTKHGMLRDNISWEAISDQLSSRSNALCCQKWYNQLTSPMVAEGKWANADDYRLLIALVDLDAACEEDVNWDDLLEHRSGDVCRKRWHQMVHHIGENGTKSFSEQVEILSQRYCPDLLESREAYDSKTPVD